MRTESFEIRAKMNYMDENSPVMHDGPRMEFCWKRIEGFFPDKLHKKVGFKKYGYGLRT